MFRRHFLATTLVTTALITTAGAALAEGKTYCRISHGGPADPVWTYFLQGAELWATDIGNAVSSSFFSGDFVWLPVEVPGASYGSDGERRRNRRHHRAGRSGHLVRPVGHPCPLSPDTDTVRQLDHGVRRQCERGAQPGGKVDRVRILLFMFSSLMAALAGIIASIRTSAANPISGTGYEPEVIAMVVIGGTALMGGQVTSNIPPGLGRSGMTSPTELTVCLSAMARSP